MYVFSTCLYCNIFTTVFSLWSCLTSSYLAALALFSNFHAFLAFGTPLITCALGTYLRPDHVRTAARLVNWCPRYYPPVLVVSPLFFFSRHARLAVVQRRCPLQARQRADCYMPDTWQFLFIFLYHRSFRILALLSRFLYSGTTTCGHCGFILYSTCALCLWGIQAIWLARSLPIPPFPARLTVFCIISCFSHSYLLYLAYVWY